MSKRSIGFSPIIPLTYVSDNNVEEISPNLITTNLVGEKAYGLLALPRLWTLPFIVVSHVLLSKYMGCSEKQQACLITDWSERIIPAAISVGLQHEDDIIVRSSGCSEGLKDRGKFCSVQGNLADVSLAISKCLLDLAALVTSLDEKVPLVIQKCIVAPSAKGHLSNERRVYEEKRDWLGEFEGERTENASFQINLRNWRKRIDVDKHTEMPLKCNLSPHVSEVLKVPATWAYNQNVRCHFEWVWDGNRIYLVQADQEIHTEGVNPTDSRNRSLTLPSTFIPAVLQEICKQHAERFEKIKNVFTYLDLGLPIARLYILDDPLIIKKLAEEQVAIELENDISQLVKHSLVIRMDIAIEDKTKRQLLPRAEFRDLADALGWLKRESKKIIESGVQEDVAFIFHNFVPATASAFAYAVPGERKVQIEALWGLPEGLYYNAHDKYVVDTQTTILDDLQKHGFTIEKDRYFKRNFVSPDKDGRWISKTLKPPYDWKGSIQQDDWIKEIAFQSRRIASAEGKPVSIMWFVDVPEECCSSKVLPWYHESYDLGLNNRPRAKRKKTPFDEVYTVRATSDIIFLRDEAERGHSNIRCIKIQPHDDDLLRNRNALREIGELTKRIDATILLEGGVLSHAYYQLLQTDANVEIVHPFKPSEGKVEFDKLVRDKIPANIEHKGEVVQTAHLTGEFLLRLLREKLIEETFEVLDAVDQDAIVGELADVNEVIDGILSHIGVDRGELEQKQRKKREKSGGFAAGTVLLETRNPLPTDKVDSAINLFRDLENADILKRAVNERPITEFDHNKLEKWHDKKKHPSSTEAVMRLLIPTVRDNWTAHSSDTAVDAKSKRNVRIKLTGTRLGARYQIEVSVYIPDEQLALFRYED
ncbi:MAG: nucleoside triphosphate pyrophosphohydrolase [Janthinobacterium lividum]